MGLSGSAAAAEHPILAHNCAAWTTILTQATVRDLRNRYTSLLNWIGAGEEIVITQRGKAIARLIPEQDQHLQTVDWSQSPAVKRDRSGSRVMSSAESLEIIHDAAGKW